jgi:hypothetical protein
MDQRAALGRAGLAPSIPQWWSEAEAIALEKSQTPPISDHLADLGLGYEVPTSAGAIPHWRTF